RRENSIAPTGQANRLYDLQAQTVDAAHDKQRSEILIAGNRAQEEPFPQSAPRRAVLCHGAPSCQNPTCPLRSRHNNLKQANDLVFYPRATARILSATCLTGLGGPFARNGKLHP